MNGRTRNKVEIEIDFITSQGDKLNLTIAAEAQAHSGHHVMRLSDSQPGAYAPHLEPVDDIVTENIKQHGKLLLGSEYAAQTAWSLDGRPDGPGHHPAAVLRPHRHV